MDNLPSTHLPTRASLVTEWAALMALCPTPLPDALRDELLDAWQEPWRHYHGWVHLGEGIGHLHSCQTFLQHPGEVGVGWWLHDAIYNPKGCDNELKSAQWARQALTGAGWPSDAIGRVEGLVMRTEGHHDPQTTDEAYFLDTDLAILGSHPSRFAEYDRQIRAEYAHIPGILYKAGRKKVMQGFARRKPLYVTRHFQDRLGAQAEHNLAPWKHA